MPLALRSATPGQASRRSVGPLQAQAKGGPPASSSSGPAHHGPPAGRRQPGATHERPCLHDGQLFRLEQGPALPPLPRPPPLRTLSTTISSNRRSVGCSMSHSMSHSMSCSASCCRSLLCH